MAHDGLARAIVPAHTSADGDAIFALATGAREGPADLDTIGTLAAECHGRSHRPRGARGHEHPGLPRRPRSPVSLTLVLLVVYSLLMAGVGLWIGRHVRATGDFFVAGRSLGPRSSSRRSSPAISAPARPSAPRASPIVTG